MNKSKFSRLLRLAWKNMKAYLWINSKMCLAFACLSFLVCLFSVYNIALELRRSELLTEFVSANYFVSSYDRTKQFTDNGWGAPELNTVWQYSYTEKMESLYGESAPALKTSHLQIEVGGIAHTDNGASKSFPTYAVENLFMENDYREAGIRLDGAALIEGELPKEEGDVVLSEPILTLFGIDSADVIGKNVTVLIKDGGGVLFSGKVSGILTDEYFQLMGHVGAANQLVPAMVLSRQSKLFKDSANVSKKYVLIYKNWIDFGERTTEELKRIGYAGTSVENWVRALNNIQIVASNLYVIIGSALAVGLILTVFLMIDKFIKVFSCTGGILLACGMEHKDLYILLAVQLLIICLAAVPLSLVFTLVGYAVINRLISRATAVMLGVPTWLFTVVFILGVISVTLIAGGFFAYAVYGLRKKSVKHFLSSPIE